MADADEAMESPAGDDAVGDEETQAEADGTDLDDVEPLPAARPCVLCGGPALHQVAGFPQHLDPAECGGTSEAAEPVDAVEPVEAATPSEPEPEPESEPKRAPKPVQVRPVGRRMQAASDTPDLIGAAVTAALAKHEGDLEAATAALVKRAIPDAMALLDETRKGGRYDVVAHPWIPDVLRKQSARGADHIWEARPKWARQELPSGAHEVTALDINGAYLSASRPTSRSASWSTPPASTTTAAGPAST